MKLNIPYASSFKNNETWVPLPKVSPRGSSTMEKLAESDSHMYCLSSLFFVVTIT